MKQLSDWGNRKTKAHANKLIKIFRTWMWRKGGSNNHLAAFHPPQLNLSLMTVITPLKLENNFCRYLFISIYDSRIIKEINAILYFGQTILYVRDLISVGQQVHCHNFCNRRISLLNCCIFCNFVWFNPIFFYLNLCSFIIQAYLHLSCPHMYMCA